MVFGIFLQRIACRVTPGDIYHEERMAMGCIFSGLAVAILPLNTATW